MAAKKGLGRGLSALITATETPENSPNSSADGANASPLEVDINKIEPNPAQPRKHFDMDTLGELAVSIKEHGILQPLIVTPADKPDRHADKVYGQDAAQGRYYIIAGERRWRAARMAQLDTVPVIVRNCNEPESLQLALIENIQREDINPVEEALSYKRLIDEFFFRQDDIAAKVGKSRGHISACLALLALCDTAKELLITGKLNAAAARVLLQVKDAMAQAEIAKKIAEDNMTASEADAYIKHLTTDGSQKGDSQDAPAAHKKDAAPHSAVYEQIERDLNSLLGAKVRINQGKQGGKIQIQYANADDLERIIGMLKCR